MPESAVLTARDRIVAMTLHGATVALEVSNQRELERVRRQVMDRVSDLVAELRSTLVAEFPAVSGLCAVDAATLCDASTGSERGRALHQEAELAERLHVRFLLAKVDTPMPGPLLVRMYALALAA